MTKKSFNVNLFNRKSSAGQQNESTDGTAMESKNPDNDSLAMEPGKVRDRGLWRDLTAYWFFGLCNNFGYVVMLTAAHDIINELAGGEHVQAGPGERPCNLVSTGAVLLADVIPGLVIKSLSPFLPFWATTRVSISCVLSIAGFVTVAFAEVEWLALTGVAFTSLASGLGEPTFLAYSSYFNHNVISTWSSGTGGAGIVGALAYSALRGFNLSNQQTLLVMIAVPVVEIILFLFLLRKPSSTKIEDQDKGPEIAEDDELEPMVSVGEKIRYVKKLLRYMLPLALVYFFEYLINQGMFELTYFPEIFLDKSEQYRWYQVTYQIGVFVSRSSVNIVKINQIWVMAVLQGINVIFFAFEAIYMFTPSIWIIFVLIFYEGLLGGGAYVNTFYRMSREVPATRREFSMGVVTLSDAVGITLAGFLAMPTHNWICGLPGGLRLQ